MVLIGNGFETMRYEYCNRSGRKLSYEPLLKAINKCKNSDECVGIYDEDCDGRGELELCKEVFYISNGVILESCIYKKRLGKTIQKKMIIEI